MGPLLQEHRLGKTPHSLIKPHYHQIGSKLHQKHLKKLAKERGHQLTCFQSDAEHELVKRIHNAREGNIDFILFNPAAFTHTSIVLRDALLAVRVPFIEIHLSNVAAREDFRQHSFFSDISVGTIAGFGVTSYELALIAAERHLG